jgi:hypothetical protein
MGWELFAFLGAAGMTALGCLLPNRWLPSLPNDKLMHFAAYALLSALAVAITPGWPELAVWLVGLFLAGWLVECLQGAFVSGRKFCWLDIRANAAGIGLVALCVALFDAIT